MRNPISPTSRAALVATLGAATLSLATLGFTGVAAAETPPAGPGGFELVQPTPDPDPAPTPDGPEDLTFDGGHGDPEPGPHGPGELTDGSDVPDPDPGPGPEGPDELIPPPPGDDDPTPHDGPGDLTADPGCDVVHVCDPGDDDTPGDDTPGDDTPDDDTPDGGTPGDDTPGDDGETVTPQGSDGSLAFTGPAGIGLTAALGAMMTGLGVAVRRGARRLDS